MNRSVRVYATKVLCLVIVPAFIFSFPALAKEDSRSEKSGEKASEKMPVEGNASFNQGYEAARKAIEYSLKEQKGPSLKEKGQDVLREFAAAMQGSTEKKDAKGDSQRGDPKTDFSKSENRNHSKANKETKPGYKANKKINLTNWVETTTDIIGTDTAKTFYYSPSNANPYDKVVAVYDTNTMTLMSATGYISTTLDSVPDLTGMALTYYNEFTNSRLEVYESAPDRFGGITQISLYYVYDTLGNVLYVTKLVTQPLNLTNIRLS